MTCPGCGTEKDMAYSVLSNGLVCLAPNCSWEMEMPIHEAAELLDDQAVFHEVEVLACA